MQRSEDWKIGAREMIARNPELRFGIAEDIQELLATGNDEDRRVGHRMARGLLELDFSTDEELLSQLWDSIPA